MSRVIKASQITGEYRIKDHQIVKEVNVNKEIEEIETEEREQKEADLRDVQEKNAIIESAEKKAAEIIEEAELEAARLREQAEQEIELAREQGTEQGFQEGFESGKIEALNKFTQLHQEFEEMMVRTKNELEKEISHLSGDVIDLAVKIAGRIVRAELEVNPQIINNIVLEMVQDMAEFEEITIQVNPELKKYIVKDDFKEAFPRQKISFIGDQTLNSGDCIIETHLGGRDGRIETKLSLLKKELLKGAGIYESA